MSAPRERGEPEKQWTTAEKNYLLAEIIKANYPPPAYLFGLITQLRILPKWDEIPIPPGRSLNSCRRVFNELSARPSAASTVQGTLGTQTPSPMSSQLPVNLKRPYPFEGSFPGSREILPKPPSAESAYGQPARVEQPPRKKRGRPTKAEAQAKAEAQTAVRGPVTLPEGVAPSGTGLGAPPAVETDDPIVQPSFDPPQPSLPPPSRMLISSMVTPVGPASVSQSSSPSGKRKRARSARSEPDYLPSAEAEAAPAPAPARSAEAYESPYARTRHESHDIPAAVVPQREESGDGYEPLNTQEDDAQAHEASRSEP